MTDVKKPAEMDLILLEPGEVKIAIWGDKMYICAQVRPPHYIAEWCKVDLSKADLPDEVIALISDRTYYPAAMPDSEALAIWTERNKDRAPLIEAAQPS